MNLITEQWIPVLCKDGSHKRIAPYQLTEDLDTNPIVKLYAPRPDFNGALAQFLIGLLQTVYCNLDKTQWRQLFTNPPSTDELKRQFMPLQEYFHLLGDGPRFMQDFAPFELQAKKSSPVSTLLIEQPGEQTLKKNTDHFIKRDQLSSLCPGCVATALYTLQINAPSGGRGHRTSMRGGGPLTTLVASYEQQPIQHLFATIWLNILLGKHFEGNQDKTIFPWMEKTVTSENNEQVLPSDVHFLQMYWSMPRRIRLLEDQKSKGICSLCQSDAKRTVSAYVARPFGACYSEHWTHFLSPYRVEKKENKKFPLHPQESGIGYRHWLSLVLQDKDSGNLVAPAVKQICELNDVGSSEIKLWAFGYDMDNMKARSWHESYMPYYLIPEINLTNMTDYVKSCLEITTTAIKYLSRAFKDCKMRVPISRQQVWQKTEEQFYSLLRSMLCALTADEQQKIAEIEKGWLGHVYRVTLEVFDRHAQINCVKVDVKHLENYVKARTSLIKKLRGKKIKEFFSSQAE